MISVLFFLSFFQTGDRRVPLRAGCSPGDEVIAVISSSESVQVEQSLAGGDFPCYKIVLRRGEKAIHGYVIDGGLPAIAGFERQRRQSSDASLEENARALSAPPERAKPAPAKTAELSDPLETPQQFPNFSGRDLTGKRVSLAGTRGRIVLVVFWSARSHAAKEALLGIQPVYNQFHARGVSVIGVCMDGASKLPQAMDDIALPWPEIADPGLAGTLGVDPRAGKTFVLDQSRRIVASGSPAEVEQTVRDLLSK